MRVIFHVVDLWQCNVCCGRSGVTRCTLFMVRDLCCMCQCGLHSVLWWHIGILMCLLAAVYVAVPEDFNSQLSICRMILLTQYSMVWDWRVLIAWPTLSYWPNMLAPFLSFTVFRFSALFQWVGIVGVVSSDC